MEEDHSLEQWMVKNREKTGLGKKKKQEEPI